MDRHEDAGPLPLERVFRPDGHNGAHARRVTGLPFLADGSYAGDAWGMVRRDLPRAACGRKADPSDADDWGNAHGPRLRGLRIPYGQPADAVPLPPVRGAPRPRDQATPAAPGLRGQSRSARLAGLLTDSCRTHYHGV